MSSTRGVTLCRTAPPLVVFDAPRGARSSLGGMPASKLLRWFLVVVALPAAAQTVSVGVKGGVPITDFVIASGYQPSVNRYIVGGALEVHLALGFALEGDGLYRHYGYSAGPYTADKVSTGDWEIPLLVKYRLPGKAVRLFADAGAALDTLAGAQQSALLVRIDNQLLDISGSPTELHHSTVFGIVGGAGLELRLGPLHLEPELRYTRWNTTHFLEQGQYNSISSKRNQLEFLVGVAF
jgi:hypothetical protein